jgi:hypothetical protein
MRSDGAIRATLRERADGQRSGERLRITTKGGDGDEADR